MLEVRAPVKNAMLPEHDTSSHCHQSKRLCRCTSALYKADRKILSIMRHKIKNARDGVTHVMPSPLGPASENPPFMTRPSRPAPKRSPFITHDAHPLRRPHRRVLGDRQRRFTMGRRRGTAGGNHRCAGEPNFADPRDIDKCPINRARYVVFVDTAINDASCTDTPRTISGSPGDGDVLLWAKGVAAQSGLDVTVREPDASPLREGWIAASRCSATTTSLSGIPAYSAARVGAASWVTKLS